VPIKAATKLADAKKQLQFIPPTYQGFYLQLTAANETLPATGVTDVESDEEGNQRPACEVTIVCIASYLLCLFVNTALLLLLLLITLLNK